MLSALPVLTGWTHSYGCSGCDLNIICLKLDEIKKMKCPVHETFRVVKMLVNLHYIPVYLQPYYEQKAFIVGGCPHPEQFYSEAISIPPYPELTDIQQDRTMANFCEDVSA